MIELVAPESVGISSVRLDEIDAAMDAYIDQGKFAGISTLIACKGKAIHLGCYGKLNISKGIPVQSDSLFRIYSLTRTSRNQKGKVTQGMACQRQEKRDKREAFPMATFPRAYCSRMWLDSSSRLNKLELSYERTVF